jgi:hypothetical protein
MKVGDLVKHKRFNICYLVTKVDNSAMVGVLKSTHEIKYIAQGWLEVISESSTV